MDQKIHVSRNQDALGVFTEDQLRTAISRGSVYASDYCWKSGMNAWATIGQTYPHLLPSQPASQPSPPAYPAPHAPSPGQVHAQIRQAPTSPVSQTHANVSFPTGGDRFCAYLLDTSVKARALLKQDIDERLRTPERFYPAFVGPLVERHVQQGNQRVFVFSDTLPLNKKRHGLEKAIAAELASRSIGQGSHTFLHHASKSNFDLQVADYCCWAIWRSLTKGDHQAMDILGQSVDLT